jgi:hypothetical protein
MESSSATRPPISNFIFLVILLAHIILGVSFSLTTPVFEAPDEDGHYLFVRYLQLYHTLPIQDKNPYGPRAVHTPLYYLMGLLLTGWIQFDAPADQADMQVNPHVWFRYEDPNPANKAMWVHYQPAERWPYQGEPLAVHLIRLLSVGFSALGVWLTYLTARQLRPVDGSFVFLATSLVAFNPMVLFMSGVAQSNTTMLAAGAAILYALSHFIQRGFTLVRWLVVGLIFSVGLLLNFGNLTLALPIGLAVLYETWRSRKLQALVVGAVGISLPVVVLMGWWFLRNRALYGTWTGTNTMMELFCCDPIKPSQAVYLFLTGLLGRFGQGLMITFPRLIYLAAAIIVILAFVQIVKVGWDRLRVLQTAAGEARSETITSLARWFIPGVTGVSVALGILFYAVTVVPGLPGRYMFPAFPSLALLLSAGLLAWFRPSRSTPVGRWQPLAAVALITCNLSLALYALFGLLWPTYAAPRTPSVAEIRKAHPLDAEIGSTARLLGYKLNTDSIQAGQPLVITVYWLPQSITEVPYTVFIHLFDPTVGSITQQDTYPGIGNWATTVWDTGRPFVDTYRLDIPADAPAVDHAQILIGLYDEKTMQRLPVTGANAGSTEEAWVAFGNIQVHP